MNFKFGMSSENNQYTSMFHVAVYKFCEQFWGQMTHVWEETLRWYRYELLWNFTYLYLYSKVSFKA